MLESPLQNEGRRFDVPEEPPPFEVDERGVITDESLPEVIKDLFSAAEHIRHVAPEILEQLRESAVFDVLPEGVSSKYVALTSIDAIKQEMSELLNAIDRRPQHGPVHGRASVDGNMRNLKLIVGALTVGNLLGVAALSTRLYASYKDQTVLGLMKAVFGVAAQAASVAVGGAGLRQLQSTQSLINKSRQLHESLGSDPRLNTPANLKGTSMQAALDGLHNDLPSPERMLATMALKYATMLHFLDLLPSIPDTLKELVSNLVHRR
jgi:hypothetical protein